MSFYDFLYTVIPILLGYSAPIIAAGLGGIFSERAGVVNVGLEGLMMFGAFAAGAATYWLEPSLQVWAPYMAILAGIVFAAIFSLLHAFICVNLKGDHVISGTGINLLASGLTVYLCEVLFKMQRTPAFSRGITKISIPVLSEIPIIGELFFSRIHTTTLIVVALVLIVWFVLYKTPFGLRLRSVGEHPSAADSMGINVNRMQYIGVLLSGAFAGLGGSVMVLTQDVQFTYVTIHGMGFIALAAVIFGKWNPVGVMLAGFFFGFSQAFAIIAYQIPFLAAFPKEVFFALPYILTVLVLVFAGKTIGPKASGKPYLKDTK